MKAKANAEASRAAGAKEEEEEEAVEVEEEERFCPHCKRDVAAANFPLHEAHCLRFLAVCPQCQERLPTAALQEHLDHAHKQVRCPLCHRTMEQYLLECHQVEECQKRLSKCSFCELELPYCKLQEHLDLCGSRTTMCYDCNKYIMYKALEEHKHTCQARNQVQHPAPTLNICQHCHLQFTDEQYILHLNKCLLHSSQPRDGVPSTSAMSSSPARTDAAPGLSSPAVNSAERPKKQDKELSSVVRPSLKPPKKKTSGQLAFAAGSQAQDPNTYEQLVTCTRCNILLPGHILKKHEKKCQKVASVPTLRRSPRHLDKREESM